MKELKIYTKNKNICFLCGQKIDRRRLRKHIKVIHNVCEKEYYSFLKENDVIDTKQCFFCKKEIKYEDIKKFNFCTLIYYSSFEKITCSNKCSAKISSKERVINDPEFYKKFQKAGVEKVIELLKNENFKNKIRLKQSKASSGKNNANYGGKYCKLEKAHELFSNKNFIERYGEEKAKKIKEKLSKAFSGEKNPMFGKPSPNGSGNGWSGWYKNWRFRSLLELSFVINVAERFKMNWESAENKKYRISYIDYEGNKKNYFPDFIVNGKYLIECKPKNLWKSKITNIKSQAAKKFCEENNLIFKLIEPKKLTDSQLIDLYENKKIKFIERYNIKFKEKYDKI